MDGANAAPLVATGSWTVGASVLSLHATSAASGVAKKMGRMKLLTGDR